MEITYEQAKKIKDCSFIDTFDPNIHRLSKYKLILLLGNCVVNGINQDGKCLFIPFDDWNDELQEGDCQDGNTDWYYHYNYLVRALASSKYEFPDNFCVIINNAEVGVQLKKSAFYELFKEVAFQGVCILSNWTYNNVNEDQYLEYAFYISEKPTEEQVRTLLEIQEKLEYNTRNQIHTTQYKSEDPIDVKDRRIFLESEKEDLYLRIKAKKIINCKMEKMGKRIKM